MNDITELAQSLKAAAENAIGAHERLAAYPYGEIIDISQQEGEQIDIDITDINEFHEEANPTNILALVEALEKAQSANAAQDDHINQQQDRIEQLEKRNAELGKYAKELESFRTAYMEWSDKTDWVQGDKRFDVLIPWGKHRADVLRAYIERLELRIAELEESHAQVIQSRDHYKRMSEEGLKKLAESRTVTVKLPDLRQVVSGDRYVWSDGVFNYSQDVKAELTAKGIKWEAE